MKHSHLIKFVMVLGIIATGCGRNYTGTWTGTGGQSQTVGGLTPTNVQLTLQLNQISGDIVSGNVTSSLGTGTFQGTAVGTGLNPVTITFNANMNAMGLGYGTMGYGGNMTQSCVYSGPLTANGNQLTGMLVSTQAMQSMMPGLCASTLTVNVTKSS